LSAGPAVRTTVSLPLLLLMAGTLGCAQPAPAPVVPMALACPPPLEPYIRTALYVDRSNRNDPSGRLTDEEWQCFVDTVLLRHFPAGGTVFSNAGWWRRPDGTTGGGPGRTLVVLAPLTEATAHRAAVQTVIAEYKARYGVRSVLWEEGQTCAAF
jgi:hypothetical protein